MKMSATPDKERLQSMLSTCYELEGLITLALERDDTTPRRIYDMIDGKIRSLSAVKSPVTPSLPFDDSEHDAEEDAAITVEVAAEPVETATAEVPVELTGVEEAEEHEEVAESAEIEQAEDAGIPAEKSAPAKKIALTIGDKFRFTKELFEGNEKDLKETLEAVSGMTSREEIDDYLFNDLCFDEMNPAVKEFEELVTKNL